MTDQNAALGLQQFMTHLSSNAAVTLGQQIREVLNGPEFVQTGKTVLQSVLKMPEFHEIISKVGDGVSNANKEIALELLTSTEFTEFLQQVMSGLISNALNDEQVQDAAKNTISVGILAALGSEDGKALVKNVLIDPLADKIDRNLGETLSHNANTVTKEMNSGFDKIDQVSEKITDIPDQIIEALGSEKVKELIDNIFKDNISMLSDAMMQAILGAGAQFRPKIEATISLNSWDEDKK